MKKYLFMALSMCAVLSCSKADLNTNKAALSFTAGFDESTKSMLNNDRSQSWTGGDKVNIYDVTNYTNFGLKATFTNNSATSSTSATFIIDDEYSTFEFVSGHRYLALHNATASGFSSYYRIDIASTISYNSERKYGMPDNTIPVACYFTYNSSSDLENMIFHNITALCVVRVTNNGTSPMHITKIRLSISGDAGDEWIYRIFGRSFTNYGKSTYNITAGSAGYLESNILCNNAIAAGSSCDYSTMMFQLYQTSSTSETLTVTVYDGSNVLTSNGKVIHTEGDPLPFGAGDTKVFNIAYDPS